MNETSALQGALLPVVRHVVQIAAGSLLTTGALTESQIGIIAGAVIAVGNLVWMLVARAQAAKAADPPT